MTAAEHVIRWSTAGAVVGVAAVAAVASYEHAYALVRAHCEAGWTGRLVPLTVDGLVYASSMVMLDAARWKTSVPALARWLLSLGIVATLAASPWHTAYQRAGGSKAPSIPILWTTCAGALTYWADSSLFRLPVSTCSSILFFFLLFAVSAVLLVPFVLPLAECSANPV